MPNVFWAVMDVMAERARPPRAEIVLMSACMPAPPVPSEPLMVSIGVTCCSNVWFAVCSFLRLLSVVLGLQSKQKNGNYRNIVPFFITIVSKCISTSEYRGRYETITQPTFIKVSPYCYRRFDMCFAVDVSVQAAL